MKFEHRTIKADKFKIWTATEQIIDLHHLHFGVDFHNSKELKEIENLKVGEVFRQNQSGWGFLRIEIQRID